MLERPYHFRFRSILFLTVCLLVSAFILDTVKGLSCWECTGNAAPLCEGNHEGKSVLCPVPDDMDIDGSYPHPPGFGEYSNYVCFIMRTKTNALQDRIEITKGCTLDEGYFISKVVGLNSEYLEPGSCYIHDDEDIYPRYVTTHEVEICICNDTDDCNKVTIAGTGQQDIIKRKSLARSGGVWWKLELVTPGVIVMMVIGGPLVWWGRF